MRTPPTATYAPECLEKLSDKSFCHHRAPASGGAKGAETALLAPEWAPSEVHSEPLSELSDGF